MVDAQKHSGSPHACHPESGNRSVVPRGLMQITWLLFKQLGILPRMLSLLQDVGASLCMRKNHG